MICSFFSILPNKKEKGNSVCVFMFLWKKHEVFQLFFPWRTEYHSQDSKNKDFYTVLSRKINHLTIEEKRRKLFLFFLWHSMFLYLLKSSLFYKWKTHCPYSRKDSSFIWRTMEVLLLLLLKHWVTHFSFPWGKIKN